MTRSHAETKRTNVSLQSSRGGYPQPQIDLRLPPHTRHRVVMAELHRLAGAIELATPDDAGWCVQLEVDRGVSTTGGRIYLELADATPAEAARGMAVLHSVVAEVYRM